ncbi:hypothetical protein GQS_07885 [Thermococcus sp. 4557]|uniref:HEPN domain-containing protein n=1 Tax=Thermococcus sp. (strain CGMCC 1.5172 / 4557) TaxID=1042877 RepID=UPI000219ECB2|nr:HEPN domain-containing protein [Thermococcus sp. 4557]AEK73473.1 hypothetical protein GQS_07885 [Thermococcus sp. 4557]
MKGEEITRELAVAEEELSSAQILYEHGKYRDAISRAYYSMFHSARALLLIKGITPKKHSGTLSMLGMSYIKEGLLDEYYGKALTKAFQMRSQADYNVMYTPSREEAEEILDLALEFLEKAQELVSGWIRGEER